MIIGIRMMFLCFLVVKGELLVDSMLRLVNSYRKSNNMSSLYETTSMLKAAEYQSGVMCSLSKLTHNGLESRYNELSDRLRMFDFVGENIGENIARQQNDDYEEVFKVWINSKEHRKNILGDYNYTGISTCKNTKGYRFWVQVFAKDAWNSSMKMTQGGLEKRDSAHSPEDNKLNEIKRNKGCTSDEKQSIETSGGSREKNMTNDLINIILSSNLSENFRGNLGKGLLNSYYKNGENTKNMQNDSELKTPAISNIENQHFGLKSDKLVKKDISDFLAEIFSESILKSLIFITKNSMINGSSASQTSVTKENFKSENDNAEKNNKFKVLYQNRQNSNKHEYNKQKTEKTAKIYPKDPEETNLNNNTNEISKFEDIPKRFNHVNSEVVAKQESYQHNPDQKDTNFSSKIFQGLHDLPRHSHEIEKNSNIDNRYQSDNFYKSNTTSPNASPATHEDIRDKGYAGLSSKSTLTENKQSTKSEIQETPNSNFSSLPDKNIVDNCKVIYSSSLECNVRDKQLPLSFHDTLDKFGGGFENPFDDSINQKRVASASRSLQKEEMERYGIFKNDSIKGNQNVDIGDTVYLGAQGVGI